MLAELAVSYVNKPGDQRLSLCRFITTTYTHIPGHYKQTENEHMHPRRVIKRGGHVKRGYMCKTGTVS